MKRTLDNCRLVARYGKPPQHAGMCDGFAASKENDEPCKTCKSCPLCSLNERKEACEDYAMPEIEYQKGER